MDEKILRAADHTVLNPAAVWEDIRQACMDAMEYHTASVCIPPSFVKQAKKLVGDRLSICTVIGFPNGYSTGRIKAMEAADAVENGADELDMVVNLGFVKSGQYDRCLEEIKEVKKACRGRILKVIIETCLLTEEEKKAMCKVVTESGADFIKTSTGFSTGGATFEDVSLLAQHIGQGIKIKAAGGIQGEEDARHFMELGASRLGTSRLVRLAKEEQEGGKGKKETEREKKTETPKKEEEEKKEAILVSACLMGTQCRYDGRDNKNDGVLSLMKKYILIPVCPEQLGGLSTPREPSECKRKPHQTSLQGRVINRKGEDVTKPFQKGAKEALALARLYGCRLAVLKEKSPSCGTAGIYDGTFTKTKIDGQGVCARLLEENGIETVGESRITEIPQILARLDKGEES